MSGMIHRHERYAAAGSGAVVLVVDDSREAASAVFDMALIPAFNHLGIPYRVVDRSALTADGRIADAAAVILAHDGVAAALTDEQWGEIAAAADGGAGVISFDGELWRAGGHVQRFFGGVGMAAAEITEAVAAERHYITAMQEPSRIHSMHTPVRASIPERLTEAVPLLRDGTGRAIAAASADSAGRRAALYVSPALWMKQHFGHAAGLDDILWRTVVWAARKPFATLMMPPFAVCRVDDCVGSYDHFGYVNVLNEYGWIPNIGLFVDDIGEQAALAIKRLYDLKRAEFSAHSFHELGEPSPDQIYLQHDGKEYSFEQLQDHFERLDRFYRSVGIAPSETVNIHYDELGLNSLPFLLRRNQTYMMALIPFGVHWYANSYSWEPYPYGHQGFNYGPMDPDHRFWNAIAHHLGGHKTPDTGMGVGEFLGGCTAFNGENDRTDVDEAIRRGAAAVKLGISSGFFGTLMTHEQRVAAVSPEDWRAIIAGIRLELADWPILYRGYDHISRYCKDKARTRISRSDRDARTGRLMLELEGTVDHGLSYNVYRNSGDRIVGEIVSLPPFAGSCMAEYFSP